MLKINKASSQINQMEGDMPSALEFKDQQLLLDAVESDESGDIDEIINVINLSLTHFTLWDDTVQDRLSKLLERKKAIRDCKAAPGRVVQARMFC